MNPIALFDGYKTYIAGVGMIGLAVYQFAQGDVETAVKTLAEGLAIVGLGHKISKAAV